MADAEFEPNGYESNVHIDQYKTHQICVKNNPSLTGVNGMWKYCLRFVGMKCLRKTRGELIMCQKPAEKRRRSFRNTVEIR